MPPRLADTTAFDGLTKTELQNQIKANAGILFPHLCRSRHNYRKDPNTVFDIVVTITSTGQIQAKLVHTGDHLSPILAESEPKRSLMHAMKALLYTVAETLGQQQRNLLEPLQPLKATSAGKVAQDAVDVGVLGISSERMRRKERRMMRLWEDRGGRSRSSF